MNDHFLARTLHTPEVDFRFSQHRLSLKGECFPEDAHAFFGAILSHIHAYLEHIQGTALELDVHLTYFNSASTKLLYKLIGEFDKAAARGNVVTLNWYFDEEDDTLQDFGLDIKDEFRLLRVELRALAAG